MLIYFCVFYHHYSKMDIMALSCFQEKSNVIFIKILYKISIILIAPFTLLLYK